MLYDVGSTVEVFTDATDTFTSLFFQDSTMKSTFSSYPEVILVDATYKLTNLRMPVYLMMSIDGNGQGEIISVFFNYSVNGVGYYTDGPDIQEGES